jgi:signal transduction histidine kinase
MGLRHRSIRLRVAILIAVPVLCLLTLYGFVASFTLGDTLTQTHAQTLKNDLAAPVTNFQRQLSAERMLALLTVASPTSTNLAAYEKQQASTTRSIRALRKAMQAPAVTSYATAADDKAIHNLLSQVAGANFHDVRADVDVGAISIPATLAAYDSIAASAFTVIDQVLSQQANVALVTQALNVVDLDRAAQASQEELDLLTADVAQGKFPGADRLMFGALSTYRQQLVAATMPQLTAPYRGYLTNDVTPAVSSSMTAAESAVVSTPWRHGAVPLAVGAARGSIITYSAALGTALAAATAELERQSAHDANIALLELILAAGLGLLGVIASIALSLVIGRRLARQLRGLRQSAMTLAQDELPGIISRLRAGEPVDVSEYAPASLATSDEVELVQQAFGVVQQAAVQSAVDEARLRRGISDVFRNLAGRSQSLLHRQLTLLDGMERRATEPEELEDLFRLDHLTTRMRRHAEGLIILSGDTPARGWRHPVPLVDVLRAAVAEVEDYTRIRVLSRTNAAVAGHAVADVIHLVAELAENATVFSPPNTPVRIQGDVVGRGFAIEIEDRGLGISAARLEEINANLAKPPQFDLSGSDRLGLFIAGQLAQRHGIKISLRPSVYGGTTAVVLLPTNLVVEADEYERDIALPMRAESRTTTTVLPTRRNALTTVRRQPALSLPPASGNGVAAVSSENEPQQPRRGFTLTGRTMPRPTQRQPANADAANQDAASPDPFSPDPFSPDAASPESQPVSQRTWPADPDIWPSGPVRRPASPDHHGGDPDHDGFDTNHQGELDQRRGRPDRLAGTSSASTSSASTSSVGAPSPSGDGDPDATATSSGVTELGLPVRIRQASLAPQLRDSPPRPAGAGSSWAGSGMAGAGGTAAWTPPDALRRDGSSGPAVSSAGPAGATPDPAGPASGGPALTTPEAARSMVSALQRGWQLGRSEAADEGSTDLPSREPTSPLPRRTKDSAAPPTDAEPADAEPTNSEPTNSEPARAESARDPELGHE